MQWIPNSHKPEVYGTCNPWEPGALKAIGSFELGKEAEEKVTNSFICQVTLQEEHVLLTTALKYEALIIILEYKW